MTKPDLTVEHLKAYSAEFLGAMSKLAIKELFGVNNGKTIGTFIESAFNDHLAKRFVFDSGNAASGIDFPKLRVDLKVTSIDQPQSSCPFRDASQKVYGLGYHLLVFVYRKVDDHETKTCNLIFKHAVFINAERTADHGTTKGIIERLRNGGNADDIDAFLEERHLPVDEIGRRQLAERIVQLPPNQGVLTISNALQWRLQYARAIEWAGQEEGIESVIDTTLNT
jgi:hypothetical protein